MTATTKPSKAEAARQDREDAREHLRRLFTPESVINTQVVAASPSGMSRTVQVLVAEVDPANLDRVSIRDVSIVVARAIGERFNDPRNAPSGIRISGAGFDAGHEVAYRLRAALFGNEDGEALKGLQHNRV